jgi:hypothetical protein
MQWSAPQRTALRRTLITDPHLVPGYKVLQIRRAVGDYASIIEGLIHGSPRGDMSC